MAVMTPTQEGHVAMGIVAMLRSNANIKMLVDQMMRAEARTIRGLKWPTPEDFVGLTEAFDWYVALGIPREMAKHLVFRKVGSLCPHVLIEMTRIDVIKSDLDPQTISSLTTAFKDHGVLWPAPMLG